MSADRSIFDRLKMTLGPLFLLLVCPTFALIIWYTCAYLDGSFQRLWQLFIQVGFIKLLALLWSPHILGSSIAWTMIGCFIGFQMALMRLLPGKIVEGPVTPKGNIPKYRANGILAFVTTLFTFWLCAFQLNIFSPGIVYNHFGDLIGALNALSLLLCLGLYFKGIYFPSSADCGKSGNFIFDYYWGTELYPRMGGFDVKMLTNCRLGMMGWAVIIISFAAKQSEVEGLSNAMLISVSLQLLYIFKFFCWEPGYLRSLDIMHDRAGFYICWGCLVWVPSVYTSPALYLVNHPNHLKLSTAIFLFACGLSAILINYLADRQRQLVRATKGQCLVWGRTPAISVVNYQTTTGENKQNLLLSSGWWGISRHFHYVPEIIAAFCWSAPALFTHFLPYFYVCFLTILLCDRAMRDDKRCANKYGEGWVRHCRQVKYKIIPFVY